MDVEIVTAIIAAVSASGGLSGLLGFHSHNRAKKIKQEHMTYKTDLDIKVAKLEQKVHDLDKETHNDIKDIKGDIHYIRTKLEEK
ncbi:hypothetical protein [Herbiconiux daphne]|uniref:Uncharacterized protein n=1 Tax=Herbiconiux daphne TaxID=2970914 RepID=A0ABT2H972_9MICO|nr:hypothetical protein [Herbiconiux daphne]MCS5736448.1 hypothetical protein [Herbiconiux daphne]